MEVVHILHELGWAFSSRFAFQFTVGLSVKVGLSVQDCALSKRLCSQFKVVLSVQGCALSSKANCFSKLCKA